MPRAESAGPQGDYRIRQANHRDLDETAAVLARVWQEAYVGLIDDAVLSAKSDPERLARAVSWWRDALDQGEYLWLGVHRDGHIVGAAHAAVARDADAPQLLELTMINLLAESHGTGLADHLLEYAIGDAPAYLWVLESNERAQAFYRKHGFVTDGATKPYRAADGPTELRMVRG